MPMQPRPRAETSRSASLRCNISPAFRVVVDGTTQSALPVKRKGSPHGDVALHHAIALGQLDAAGQGAAERAEGLLVARAQDQEVVVAGPHRAGLELERPSLRERDRAAVLREPDRSDLARRRAVPDRALA